MHGVCVALKWELGDVLEKNVEKLKLRFPQGFVEYSQRGDNFGVDE